MGLLGILNNHMLLQWQKLVMKDSPNRLVMSKKQLLTMTAQIVENDLRIVNDCQRILQTTKNYETFYTRLDLLEEKLVHLKQFEPYI